jgi:PAS domain S-box-containing protein
VVSAEKLAALVESLGAIVWEADGRTFQFTFVSGQVEEILGYPKSEWLRDPQFWRNHTHPDDIARCTAFCIDATARGRDHSFEYRMVAADGRVVWLRDIVTVKQIPGQAPRLTGVMLDITEQIEEARRFRQMIERAWDKIAVVNASGYYEYLSPSVERMLGYRPDELTGTNGFDLIAPNDRERVARYLADVVKGFPRYTPVQFRMIHKNGEMRVIESVASLLADQGDPRVVFNSRDVTEKLELEERLSQATKMEALGQLAGGVAHDFNNLLTVITGYAEMVREHIQPGDQRRQDVEEIRRAADRATILTSQLLAFSRKQVLHARVQDLNTIVREVGGMIARVIGETIELRLDLSSQTARVVADRGQIEQILLNLAVNARDAMTFGGTLTLRTRVEDVNAVRAAGRPPLRPGRYVCLEVVDTGTGIAADVQPHIFEPFFTTKPPGKGTGLGLSTVFGIVKQSGGYIFVDSRDRNGTTFTTYLPEVPTEVALEAGEEAAPAQTAATGRETVLLVEDEAAVRDLTEQVLRRQGYRVLAAATGTEALQISREFSGPIELLITDIVMAGMSGPEVAAKLENSRPQTAVLYMSGYAGDSVLGAGNEKGIAFLQKPFTPIALAQRVREVLDERKASTEANP